MYIKKWMDMEEGVQWNIQFSSVSQSCPTLCDPVDCSLPGFSVHEILQARILEWVAMHALLFGIFLTQGLSPHSLMPLHWQAGFLALAPPGKPSGCVVVFYHWLDLWFPNNKWCLPFYVYLPSVYLMWGCVYLDLSLFWVVLLLMSFESFKF